MESQNPSARRPNLVFFIADDHSYSAVGAYGNQQVKTPVMDRLAQEGVLFRSAYTMGAQTAAVCVPSRACLHTGASVYRSISSDRICLENHEDDQLWHIHPQLPTWPEVFRQAGYHTYGIGKWHNGAESFTRSFSGGARLFFGGMSEHTGMPLHDYDAQGRYADTDAESCDGFSTDVFADAAVDFIERYEREEPFVLYIAFTAPHDPRTPPGRYRSMFDPETIELPANYADRHPFDNGELSIRDEMLAPIPRQPAEVKKQLADYYGMIAHLDERIGDVLGALERRSFDANTIIAYTSDHGLAIGQHGLMGKQNLYEHSVRIPLIMKGQNFSPLQLDGLCSQIDIFPTLCDLAGLTVPDSVEGRSLVPVMTGRERQVRDSVFAVYKDVQRMVCDGRWKLIRYYRSAERGVGTDRLQLFDIRHDVWERFDLSADARYRPELERMLEILRLRQTEIGDPLLEILVEDT